MGVLFPNGGDDLLNCFHVQKAHQVEPKAIHMVFIRPVVNRVHNVFANHSPLRGGVVAAAGAIGKNAVAVFPTEIAGHDLIHGEFKGVIHMVVNHVQDDSQAVLVQGVNHLLHLPDPGEAIKGIGRVGTLRHIEVHRVIAPVVFLSRVRFIHRAIVKHGQQVNVGDAQLLDVGKAGGLPGF